MVKSAAAWGTLTGKLISKSVHGFLGAGHQST